MIKYYIGVGGGRGNHEQGGVQGQVSKGGIQNHFGLSKGFRVLGFRGLGV